MKAKTGGNEALLLEIQQSRLDDEMIGIISEDLSRGSTFDRINSCPDDLLESVNWRKNIKNSEAHMHLQNTSECRMLR